jgi:hypothetical protein
MENLSLRVFLQVKQIPYPNNYPTFIQKNFSDYPVIWQCQYIFSCVGITSGICTTIPHIILNLDEAQIIEE